MSTPRNRRANSRPLERQLPQSPQGSPAPRQLNQTARAAPAPDCRNLGRVVLWDSPNMSTQRNRRAVANSRPKRPQRQVPQSHRAVRLLVNSIRQPGQPQLTTAVTRGLPILTILSGSTKTNFAQLISCDAFTSSKNAVRDSTQLKTLNLTKHALDALAPYLQSPLVNLVTSLG